MGEDAQLLSGREALDKLFMRWLRKTRKVALKKWRSIARASAAKRQAREKAIIDAVASQAKQAAKEHVAILKQA